MMPKKIFLHSFFVAILFFVCVSENSKVSAASPELGEEQVQRIGALIASAQEVLERAAALGANARGAGESVMFLAAAAARHVPGMLETLSSFGINDADLVRYQLIGDASPISWVTTLCRQNVLERRAFDVAKLTNGLSKAGDFVAGLGINPQIFMTQTYSLVRFL